MFTLKTWTDASDGESLPSMCYEQYLIVDNPDEITIATKQISLGNKLETSISQGKKLSGEAINHEEIKGIDCTATTWRISYRPNQ